MDLYDVAVARKLSSGGGGGSSDFSTAEVTVIGAVPTIYGSWLDEQSEQTIYKVSNSSGVETAYNLVLYKGVSVINFAVKGEIVLSGSIESIGNAEYIVTGDCTITIS